MITLSDERRARLRGMGIVLVPLGTSALAAAIWWQSLPIAAFATLALLAGLLALAGAGPWDRRCAAVAVGLFMVHWFVNLAARSEVVGSGSHSQFMLVASTLTASFGPVAALRNAPRWVVVMCWSLSLAGAVGAFALRGPPLHGGVYPYADTARAAAAAGVFVSGLPVFAAWQSRRSVREGRPE